MDLHGKTGIRLIWVRSVLRLAVKAALAALLLLTFSCSGSLYKVKPIAELVRMPDNAATATLGSLAFRAAPLLTEEQSQDLFDSNFQLAGLLPVRIEMIHNGGDSIDLKKMRLRLHDNNGTEWKLISFKQAVARIMKANGVTLYNPDARKTFEKDFRAYELDLKSPIAETEQGRRGFVIFLSPKKQPVASPHGLALTIEGLSQPATLKLN
jgi:hypothetical protein